MTRQFTGLYFPETIAQYPGFSQLLLFFDAIIQYVPAEDSLTPDELLVKEKLILQHTPVAFGDGLISFQKLINDIQGHGNAFFNSYLSSLSNSATIDIDEASVWNLIGKLTPHTEKSNHDKEDILLQARLLLKLAEIHQQEEREIGKQMERLRDKKESLLATLKGDFSVTGLDDMLPAQETESPSRFRQRCKAWSHLLLAESTPAPWMAVTHSADIIESFQDAAGTDAQKEPLFQIPLTSLTSKDSKQTDYLVKRHDFLKATKSCREIFYTFLTSAASGDQATAPDNETLEQWQQVMQKEPAVDPATLQFFRFQIPLPQLCSQTFGIPADPNKNSPSQPNTIIALLSQNESP